MKLQCISPFQNIHTEGGEDLLPLLPTLCHSFLTGWMNEWHFLCIPKIPLHYLFIIYNMTWQAIVSCSSPFHLLAPLLLDSWLASPLLPSCPLWLMMDERRSRQAFTISQLQELELQALIFNYMALGIPIPSHLIFPFRRSFGLDPFSLHSSSKFFNFLHKYHQVCWFASKWGRPCIMAP